LSLTGATLLAAGLLSPARAQDQDDLQRGVARISLINGEVSVRRGDSGDWVAGVINAPLMSEDQIATGANSRAEVEFDAANILRIGGNAQVRLSQLESGRYQMEVGKGTVTYRVLRISNANAEVDTPSVSVRPSKQGIYRIYVNDAGETQVTARAGDVEVFTPRGSQWVNAGQTMLARGSSADPEFQIVAAIPPDDWDRWSESRDRMMLQSQSPQYVGQGVYGTEDLDANGTWVDAPPYGAVWRPTAVSPGWAPYSSGRWVWEDWYGWVWVSYDPWGWAPYHYGRWFSDPRWGWCWYPGGFGFRHYWSPALVAFFGFGGGGGFGFGFGFGNLGWVPLAPFEAFHPWWGRSFYGRPFSERNMNIQNVNVTNLYRNARVTGGISAMRAGDFQSGRFNSVTHPSGSAIGQAGLVRGQMPVSPTNAHLNFSDRSVANAPRTNFGNTRFFTHQQPSAVQRVPFAQQRSGGGTAAGAGGIRGQSESGVMNRGSQPNAGGGGAAWRRFGEPGGQGGAANNLAPRNENGGVRNSAPNRSIENTRPPSSGSGGFSRFGNPGSSAPRYNAPSNNAPRNSAPSTSYSAPRSTPSYSAPRGGGGGGSSRPSGGGGHGGGGGSKGHR